jgi:MYXO-CTERM domain-containing protein
MFYNPTFLETSKRTLSADDVDAVCSIYAPSMYHEACALDEARGCDVSSRAVSPGRFAVAGGAIAMLAALAHRRRQRRVSARARA